MSDETRKQTEPPAQAETQPHRSGIQELAAGPTDGTRIGAGTRLRNYFLTGLVVAAPISITAYITWWFITLVDSWIKPFLPSLYNPDTYLPFTVPGVGLIVAIFGLTVLGALTANLFGRTIVAYSETMLNRMPIVRNLYNALKQIFETVLSQSQSSFQQAALIEYPRKGIWSVVFVSTRTKGEVQHKTPVDGGMLSVFLPTTPNPTSGYLLFVPEKDVIILDMTVEDAAKMVISAGLVTPDLEARQRAELEKLARRAKREKARTGARAPVDKTEKV